jgi:hypothetical protein
VAWINNLDVNLEGDRPKHDAGNFRGFVPLIVRAGGKSKAVLATRMVDVDARDGNWFIAVCIVLGDDPDISRPTDARVDSALS